MIEGWIGAGEEAKQRPIIVRVESIKGGVGVVLICHFSETNAMFKQRNAFKQYFQFQSKLLEVEDKELESGVS